MNLRNTVASWFSRSLPSGEYDNGGTSIRPANWLVDMLGGGTTTAGTQVSERTAEGIPAIYACVHVISETAGQVDLDVYRRITNGRTLDVDHPLQYVLHEAANANLTAMQFREMVTRHLAIWGRAYAMVERNRRREIVGLWPLHPARMFVEYNGLNQKVFKYWMGKGDYREWVHNPENPDILHLHINSDDGLDGRSPLQINRESLGITLAAEQYVGAWFGNGAIPGIIATHPNRLSDKAKDSIRKSWLEKFMGAKKANKFAILEEGIQIHVVGVDPEKSQLDKLRAAQIEAAARIYRVPLFMIQNQTKDTSWGSGIEQQMQGFINLTMGPWLKLWTQCISRDLLTRKSYKSHEVVFDTSPLLRGDLKSRVEAYASARQNGWLNGNEIRDLEDLNPINDGSGDVFWMPSNMAQVVDGAPVLATPAQPVSDPQIDPEDDPEVDDPGQVM